MWRGKGGREGGWWRGGRLATRDCISSFKYPRLCRERGCDSIQGGREGGREGERDSLTGVIGRRGVRGLTVEICKDASCYSAGHPQTPERHIWRCLFLRTPSRAPYRAPSGGGWGCGYLRGGGARGAFRVWSRTSGWRIMMVRVSVCHARGWVRVWAYSGYCQVGEIASAPLSSWALMNLGVGHLPFTNKIQLSSSPSVRQVNPTGCFVK
jgi:hypothetical protein